MEVKVGCDIVEIERFNKLDEKTINKIFHKTELRNPGPEKLAGLFAAKESCKKVFNNLSWLDIEIKKKKDGKPALIFNTQDMNKEIMSYDLSISHDKDYAIATVVFLKTFFAFFFLISICFFFLWFCSTKKKKTGKKNK